MFYGAVVLRSKATIGRYPNDSPSRVILVDSSIPLKSIGPTHPSNIVNSARHSIYRYGISNRS